MNQTVKQLEDKERKAGYSDMPYHFVITSDGKIYEGRSIQAVGAHAGEFKGNKDITKDPDYGAIGIVLTGDFESRIQNGYSPDQPTLGQLQSMRRLINHLVCTYKIDSSQILKHSEVKRDGAPKVCPGANLSPQVDLCKPGAKKALEQWSAAEKALVAVQKEAASLK